MLSGALEHIERAGVARDEHGQPIARETEKDELEDAHGYFFPQHPFEGGGSAVSRFISGTRVSES